MTGPLDPAAAGAAGAAHGQLASALAGGGLVLSAHKLVEEGARALVLIAPGLFRLDVKTSADTLQVATRSLHPESAGTWAPEEHPPARYGEPSAQVEIPLRMGWRYELAGAAPLVGHVQLLVTTDRAARSRHFAAHAVLRPAHAAGGPG